MLTGRFDRNTTFDQTDFRSAIPRFQPENLKHNVALVEYVEELARRKETSPARIAIGWLLAQKPWIVPIREQSASNASKRISAAQTCVSRTENWLTSAVTWTALR